jgi:class 3 adenylate cyclase
VTPEVGLPSGTVTFLFTDIESSSSRWEADAVEMRATLARHDQVLSSVIEASSGFVFKHLGDGVCAAFSSAPAAMKAAVECQARLAAEAWGGDDRLRVRMGLHSGEALPTGGDYFGPPVNRAARVMGTANGGQVVCSAATAALCPDVEFRDAGIHQLAGVGAEHLFVAVFDSGDVRPLRSSSAAAPPNLVSALDFLRRSKRRHRRVG